MNISKCFRKCLGAKRKCKKRPCYAAALRALRRWPRIVVLLSGEDGTRCPGVAGFDESRERLVAAGAPAASVEDVPFDEAERLLHTKNEADAFVAHCLNRGFARVLVAAPPLHALRAFATACSSAIATGARLRLYNYCGRADDWNAVVTHSQGPGQEKGDSLQLWFC